MKHYTAEIMQIVATWIEQQDMLNEEVAEKYKHKMVSIKGGIYLEYWIRKCNGLVVQKGVYFEIIPGPEYREKERE